MKITIEVEYANDVNEPTAFAGGLRDNIITWFDTRKIPCDVKVTKEQTEWHGKMT